MKRLTALCLALFMLAALAGCGDAEAPKGVSPAPATPTLSENTPEPASGASEAGTREVTVSTIEELVAAIGNDTRVTLKAGTYNFSELAGARVTNPAVQVYGIDNYIYRIHGVSNLTLEAEQGAEVSIVTENPSVAVLEFWYCSNATLRGLTCGHDVERGFCSGSVLGAYRTSGLIIEDSHLYGSGTYGLDVSESTGITVSNTDIYECTEGIVMLYDVSNAQFRDCRFYENDGYNMFALSDCWDVLFEDVEIHDNRSGDPQYPVIDDMGSVDIVFRRCTFKDNYCDPDPGDYTDTVFEDCDFLAQERDEQYVGYARMLGTSDDGSFIYLRINEVTWISWDDEELMAHYGITRDDMPNDYYIADDAEEYFPCVAYADSVEFSILKPDPQYGFTAPTPVDMAEFVSCFDAYDGKLLVTFATDGKEYGGYTSLSEISQLYVP